MPKGSKTNAAQSPRKRGNSKSPGPSPKKRNISKSPGRSPRRNSHSRSESSARDSRSRSPKSTRNLSNTRQHDREARPDKEDPLFEQMATVHREISKSGVQKRVLKNHVVPRVKKAPQVSRSPSPRPSGQSQ